MVSQAASRDRDAPAIRRRGDKQRQAILQAVRELLEERPFAELSVSTISMRAGVARSGFYFYFDSKYAVLAQILAEAAEELEELHAVFRSRGSRRVAGGSSPSGWSAAPRHGLRDNDPVMSACNAARHTDTEIRDILDRQFERGACRRSSPSSTTR